MRLIDTRIFQTDGRVTLEEFLGPEFPSYAILSHTWGLAANEFLYKDIEGGQPGKKDAFKKIRFLCEQAFKDGLWWAWCDTCCIDKSSSAELSESINSMYRWYKSAAKCYALLSDVSRENSNTYQSQLPQSTWFTRCWTLQELLAPSTIEFFSGEYEYIGDKKHLLRTINEITGIPIQVLARNDFSMISVDDRFTWMKNRKATREEDKAYSLFGIFGVQLPVLYGEGAKLALQRLRKKVTKQQAAINRSDLQDHAITTSNTYQTYSLCCDSDSATAALQTTLHEFRESISEQEKEEFQLDTMDSLNRFVLKLQEEQEAHKSLMNLRRMEIFMEGIRSMTEIFDFVVDSTFHGLVWGPVRFILSTTAPFPDVFDIILDAYQQLGEVLPENPNILCSVQVELVRYYAELFAFHRQVLGFCRSPLWRRIFKPLWKGYTPAFEGAVDRLRQFTRIIEARVAQPHHERYRFDVSSLTQQTSQTSTSVFGKKKTHADIVQAFQNVENEKISGYQEHRRKMTQSNRKLNEQLIAEKEKKLEAVKEWLAVGSYAEVDHEGYQRIRKEHTTTAQWILRNDQVKNWVDSEIPKSANLWIHGVPGAGKTILASSIIDHCKEIKSLTTIYFYCHERDQNSNTALSILKGLINQLLGEDEGTLPLCHTRRAASGDPKLRSILQAQRVLEDCCILKPRLFIIVDGLDECDVVERKQTIDILTELVVLINDRHKEARVPLRVLFVSQEYADIKRTLHPHSDNKVIPETLKLKDDEVAHDIRTYTRVWVDKIASKFSSAEFPFVEDMRDYIRNLTAANAKGMFLYSKLVLKNLYDQVRLEDLIAAIQEETFPKGLQDAYERILQRIKKTSSAQEWEAAKRLLGWMVCAKRQLTWKEIQVALSIDVETQEILYDERRLRKHIHDICGSLVSLDDDRVSLVHSTAKTFITKTSEGIHEPTIECELASLCLRYLTFPCFDEDERDERKLESMMLQGHFAFQDYAVAKWFYHVNAFVISGPKFLKEAADQERYLAMFSAALDEFMVRYDDEDWSEGLVEDCQRQCEIFDGAHCLENLVLLTSHIYTFQHKGFEARPRISIKSLATALERNRKLLENFPSAKYRATRDLEKYHTLYDGDRLFKCNQVTCRYFSEGFSDEKARKRHVNMHDRPFHCEVPDCLGAEGFANYKDLQKHNRSFHPENSDLAETFNSIVVKRENAVHACTMCGKTFTRKFHKDNHEKSHRGEKPHECPECGRAFTRKNDMERHRRTIHERGR